MARKHGWCQRDVSLDSCSDLNSHSIFSSSLHRKLKPWDLLINHFPLCKILALNYYPNIIPRPLCIDRWQEMKLSADTLSALSVIFLIGRLCVDTADSTTLIFMFAPMSVCSILSRITQSTESNCIKLGGGTGAREDPLNKIFKPFFSTLWDFISIFQYLHQVLRVDSDFN